MQISAFWAFLGILGVYFSEALRGHAPGEKATDPSKVLDLGSQNFLLQHRMCPTYVSKITPPYCLRFLFMYK